MTPLTRLAFFSTCRSSSKILDEAAGAGFTEGTDEAKSIKLSGFFFMNFKNWFHSAFLILFFYCKEIKLLLSACWAVLCPYKVRWFLTFFFLARSSMLIFRFIVRLLIWLTLFVCRVGVFLPAVNLLFLLSSLMFLLGKESFDVTWLGNNCS